MDRLRYSMMSAAAEGCYDRNVPTSVSLPVVIRAVRLDAPSGLPARPNRDRTPREGNDGPKYLAPESIALTDCFDILRRYVKCLRLSADAVGFCKFSECQSGMICRGSLNPTRHPEDQGAPWRPVAS
jgi:hypothetical protein